MLSEVCSKRPQGTGETAQWVKTWIWIPVPMLEEPGVVACTCNPSTGQGRDWRVHGALACQFSPVQWMSLTFRDRRCLKKYSGKSHGERQQCHLWSSHVYTHTHTWAESHTHMHTQEHTQNTHACTHTQSLNSQQVLIEGFRNEKSGL